MVRTSTKNAPSSMAAPSSVVSADPVLVADKVVAVKKSKKVAAVTTTEVVANADVPVATTPEVASDADVPVAESTVTVIQKLAGEIDALTLQHRAMVAKVQEYKTNLAAVHKLIAKVVRDEAKRLTKKAKSKQATKASGLNKLTLISDELADFIGVAHGSSVSRKHVSNFIHQYAVDNNLRKPEDKRLFLPDAKMISLLGLAGQDTSKLGYFTVHAYTGRHFLESPK